MHLPIYIFRRFFESLLAVSFFVLSLVFLTDFVNQLAQFGSQGVSGMQIFLYCLLRMFDNFLLFLPLIVLLSSLACFLRLSQSSEIVVMRAAGVAAVRFVFVPVFAVLIMGILIITFFNPVFVSARNTAQSYENQFQELPDGIISVGKDDGIWLRSEVDGQERVIRLSQVNWKNEFVRGVTIYTRSPNGDKIEIHSERASIQNNEWKLQNVVLLDYSNGVEMQKFDKYTLPTNDEFQTVFSDYFSPRNLTNFKLPGYIQELDQEGYDSLPARGYFYQQLALPIMLVTLCMIGAIFALAPERIGGVTQRVFMAIGLGFLVYGTSRVAESLGIAGTIPIAISVIAIPIPALFLSCAFLLKVEDG